MNPVVPDADQIALPDFNAGAMENWGLITYRETALLYDDKFSSSSNKERIASIIGHELAHMVSLYLTMSDTWCLFKLDVVIRPFIGLKKKI